MNARKQKKKTDSIFEQTATLEFQNMKQMALELFDFQEQFMSSTFLINETQFEKTWLLKEFFIPLGNLKTKFRFRN